MVNRGLATAPCKPGATDWATLREQHLNANGALRVGGIHPASYTPLHQRHHRQAQRRAARHGRLHRGAGGQHAAHLPGQTGDTYFCTSDIGWVVGHSYIIYGPLIAGMTAIMYEGLPIRPDAGIWWSIVEKYRSRTCSRRPRPCAC